MKPMIRCLFVVAGMLTAGTAFAQDFKSQVTAAAAQWDAALNSGDATKLSKAYTKDTIILPAGGEQVIGPEGAEKLYGGFLKGGLKTKDHRPGWRWRQREGLCLWALASRRRRQEADRPLGQRA